MPRNLLGVEAVVTGACFLLSVKAVKSQLGGMVPVAAVAEPPGTRLVWSLLCNELRPTLAFFYTLMPAGGRPRDVGVWFMGREKHGHIVIVSSVHVHASVN